MGGTRTGVNTGVTGPPVEVDGVLEVVVRLITFLASTKEEVLIFVILSFKTVS